jgi:hypothetical protein
LANAKSELPPPTRYTIVLRAGLAAFLMAMATLANAADVQISEFMASNSRTLQDDFGQFEDWVELYNNSSIPVALGGWALTDDAKDPFKWRFPATNLPPRSYLVVFASNRDRKTAGLPLHTNFRLSADGEYLALIRPDGTMATRFSPAYPPQVPDVAFGFGPKTAGDRVISTNATGRVLVPTTGPLPANWTSSGFNDTSWRLATNGIGFETGQPDEPATLQADILADNPTGYWPLNEPSGANITNYGSLGAAGHGQMVGGVVLGVPGPRPNAFPGCEAGNLAARLNGINARIEIPYSPALNPKESFTVEAWVKPARTGGPAAWLFSSLNVATGRNGYAFAQDYAAKGQWEFRLGDSSGYIAMAYGGAVDTNTWQHLAGVYDGTTARLYVNGSLAASATLGRPFEPNTTERTVIGGRINDANPYYYAGDIDNVSVIPRALSAAEIASRFHLATNAGPANASFPYAGLIRTDLRDSMLNRNSAACLRLPFTLTNASEVTQLKLRVKYDDGFAAWLNGQPVAAANAPQTLAWNSTATARHPASQALQFAEFDLSSQAAALAAGPNLLALQGLNVAATNSDLLLLCELEISAGGDYQPAPRYFVSPTPGSANGTGTADLGPVISWVGHMPQIPGTNDSLTVTCRVDQAFAAITNVTLRWRVMFDALRESPMFDDGQHGDGPAGDGVFGATIPSQQGNTRLYSAGQMVRWFLTAADSKGRTSRWPLFETPAESEEYLGTVVQPDSIASRIPTFHLFAPTNVLQPGPNTQQIGADSESGGRVALYYDGEFYDNIYMELRGNTSAGLNKKAHRLEFNPGHTFRHPGPGGRIRRSSLLAEHLDPAFIRQHLCFWFLDQMGVPSPFDYPVRLQLNGVFYQLAFHTDVLGEAQLDRLGYDPEGALYKCAGQVNTAFDSTGGFQKLLPKTNLVSRADYLELASGIRESNPLTVRRAAVFDRFDVAQIINYLSCARWVAENDDVWANMTLYRDTFGDGLWRIIPFDMNASWGQLYGGISPLQATTDTSKSHPFYGGSQVQENGNSMWNRIYDVVVALPETRDMLRRRQRTVLDTLVQPPGTPSNQLIIENYIRQLTNQIHPEAILDRQKWGYSPWASGQSFPRGVSDLFTQFIPQRRAHWYVTHCVTNTAKPIGVGSAYNAALPLSQPTNAAITVDDWDVNPASGNQDEEFVCLTNQNSYAVDVSGWKLQGAVTHKLRPGTVIPAGSSLYLSPNVAAFRARATGPRGGLGLFVQGDYEGHLSAWGETLTLTDLSGRTVSQTNFTGSPSLAQQFLRITEIMYNPAPLAGSSYESQSYEYLKLKNVSPSATLDLRGVRLTNGIFFHFSTNKATQLPPGQTLLLARDTNAFRLRYGTGLAVAGQFVGALENAGETLRLEDASGEKILEFAYNNRWYPLTDGLGFSLETVDEHAPWSFWDQKANWRSSGTLDGSPGEANPAPSTRPPILVTEVLAHSDPPLFDFIELHNPTLTNVDIGGWLLSDDFYTPRKYRVPAGTSIPAGGFLVFSDALFSAGATGFRLSEYGEQICLYSADAATNLTGYAHAVDLDYSPNGVSFGRHITSQGEAHFVLQSALSLGANNAPPRTGPIIISEIHYHPPELSGGVDNDLEEFIELQNLTTNSVPLYCTFTNEAGYGLAAATNTWRLREGVDYEFPPDTTLAADGRLLVVGFELTNATQLAAFRTRYEVPAEVPIFGPWRGKLDNSGETIELKSPDKPDVTATNILVPYAVIDRVHYHDQPPWSTNADGAGFSLQRLRLSAYGNDPANWSAAAPNAGRRGVHAPTITAMSLTGSQVHISVDSEPGLKYVLEFTSALEVPAWTPLSSPVPGTGGTLVFEDTLHPGNARFYRVRVSP